MPFLRERFECPAGECRLGGRCRREAGGRCLQPALGPRRHVTLEELADTEPEECERLRLAVYAERRRREEHALAARHRLPFKGRRTWR